MRSAFCEQGEELVGRRVDEADAVDHDRRYGLVSVRVPSHDRRIGGIVPDVVLHPADTEPVEAPLQPSAWCAARQISFTRRYWSGGNGAGKRYRVPLPTLYLAS